MSMTPTQARRSTSSSNPSDPPSSESRNDSGNGALPTRAGRNDKTQIQPQQIQIDLPRSQGHHDWYAEASLRSGVPQVRGGLIDAVRPRPFVSSIPTPTWRPEQSAATFRSSLPGSCRTSVAHSTRPAARRAQTLPTLSSSVDVRAKSLRYQSEGPQGSTWLDEWHRRKAAYDLAKYRQSSTCPEPPSGSEGHSRHSSAPAATSTIAQGDKDPASIPDSPPKKPNRPALYKLKGPLPPPLLTFDTDDSSSSSAAPARPPAHRRSSSLPIYSYSTTNLPLESQRHVPVTRPQHEDDAGRSGIPRSVSTPTLARPRLRKRISDLFVSKNNSLRPSAAGRADADADPLSDVDERSNPSPRKEQYAVGAEASQLAEGSGSSGQEHQAQAEESDCSSSTFRQFMRRERSLSDIARRFGSVAETHSFRRHRRSTSSGPASASGSAGAATMSGRRSGSIDDEVDYGVLGAQRVVGGGASSTASVCRSRTASRASLGESYRSASSGPAMLLDHRSSLNSLRVTNAEEEEAPIHEWSSHTSAPAYQRRSRDRSSSGTMHRPSLETLHSEGWVTAREEQGDAHSEEADQEANDKARDEAREEVKEVLWQEQAPPLPVRSRYARDRRKASSRDRVVA